MSKNHVTLELNCFNEKGDMDASRTRSKNLSLAQAADIIGHAVQFSLCRMNGATTSVVAQELEEACRCAGLLEE